MTTVVRITVSKAREQRVRARVLSVTDGVETVHAEEITDGGHFEVMLPEFIVHSGMYVVVDELPADVVPHVAPKSKKRGA